ncbi:hypothetical protein OEZ86_004174 [Tetradesmus obliquus]|nr:hypothetical protein OEZ86_004174 [Tetradesmus obliquus]
MRQCVGLSPSRGLELLGSLTACLQDPAPGVAAIGLTALDTLLERDDLDFYKAWPLVAKAWRAGCCCLWGGCGALVVLLRLCMGATEAQPPPAAAAAGDAEAAAYGVMFGDIAARWSAAGGALTGQSGLAAASWESFMRRWLVVARRSPDALLQRLSTAWGGGLPGPAAAALAAAAGLAAGGVLGESQLQEVLDAMQGLAGGSSRSSSVAAAAVTALSRLLPVLHPSDWSNKEALVNVLHNTLMDCCCDPGSSDSTGDLAAAAVAALGYAGAALQPGPAGVR